MPVEDTAKHRLQSRIIKGHKDTLESVAQADDKIEKLLIRRFDRLVSVRRFVFLWIILFVLMVATTFGQIRALSHYYQSLQPIAGGIYTEGVIGSFTNANPLYASGAADTAVSRLIFSGLFRYDQSNRLVGDLAANYNLNDNQTVYTVHLRKNVHWQDGKPFTADDVVYTYTTIQNVEAQSSLYSSWQGITVAKKDNYTVTFSLPNALSSFPYALTNGIIPSHLLSKVAPDQLRSSSFNTSPVGTGPFSWKYVEVTGNTPQDRQQRVGLTANKKYYGGSPKLDGFSLITFSDDQHLLSSFEKKQINAMSGLEVVPPDLAKDKSVQVYSTPLTAEVDAFFNNSHPLLSDANIRKALAASIDRRQLVGLLGTTVQLANGPLLTNQLGYDPALTEPAFNQDAANQMLDQAGYARGADGFRAKDGKPLSFNLSAQNTADYTKVAQFLQQQWAKLGVKITVNFYSSDDLQASIIGSHNYDILLYGISIGVDPDVFAYWDSSQASLTSQGHLNLSEYKSTAADAAIQAGRTRADPAIRAVKYKAFLAAWTSDMPAVALYQPNYVYISRGPVFNYQRKADNSSADRLYNVANWEIRQQRQTNT